MSGYGLIEKSSISVGESPPKKLGWFGRWFFRKSQEAWEHARFLNEPANPVPGIRRDTLRSPAGLSFHVYAANGGHVIEFSRYDSIKDRTTHGLHLISDDADFAAELGKIVMLETLRS